MLREAVSRVVLALPRLCFALGLLLPLAAARAQPVSTPNQSLRVAVYNVPPYGYVEDDGEMAGVSVALWRRVAEQMERQFQLIPVSDMETLLSGIENQRFDVGIGAITITPDRDRRVDFSYPAHRSGVAIALRRNIGPWSALQAYASAALELSGLIVLALALLILTGFLMWIIERRSKAAERGESHVTTLRDGLYWAVVTMTTVGYGDKTPKTSSGRFVATLWMFGSLVLVSLLSASLVSRLTADRVERNSAASTIDLGDRKIGAVGQSSGAEYLDGRHIGYSKYSDLPQALDALNKGQVDAVVNSVGALQYYVAKRFSKRLEVADGLLAPAYMAFALPKGSRLKQPIDLALMKITPGLEWVSLEGKFFAQ